jgi:hypothetical protein
MRVRLIEHSDVYTRVSTNSDKKYVSLDYQNVYIKTKFKVIGPKRIFQLDREISKASCDEQLSFFTPKNKGHCCYGIRKGLLYAT